MKKVLSIVLALSFVVQPAYSIAQPANQPKKGVVTRVKEKASAMGEAVKKAGVILKEHSQCLLLGKGENCTPERRGALRSLRSFTQGKAKDVLDRIRNMESYRLNCLAKMLSVVLVVPVEMTAPAVKKAIIALFSSSREKRDKLLARLDRMVDLVNRKMYYELQGFMLPEFLGVGGEELCFRTMMIDLLVLSIAGAAVYGVLVNLPQLIEMFGRLLKSKDEPSSMLNR